MPGLNFTATNPQNRSIADRIALRGVTMHAVLTAMSQKTQVDQTFINRESFAIEAVYTFPLPDGAAVCGFEVITGDRVLTGVVEETDAAIEKYESSIAAGDAAYMTEQDRPDVFTIRVGNIKPRQAATIRLTYICSLDVNDNQIRVSFPTTVAPRYITEAGTDPLEAAIDGDALNPPHVMNVPYGLTLSAQVQLGRKVKSIVSPTHSLQVTGDDEQGYHLWLASPVLMNRDVVVNIELAKEVGPTVQFESGKDNQSYLAVTFIPEFDSQPRQVNTSETVFVLDCSGSMAGQSMEQATAALELCLRSLSEGDTFNICKFGSTYEMMKREAVIYSQNTLDEAVRYIASGNDLGGTELFAALETVLRTRPERSVVRNVILLTDGQVSNEPAILAMARRHRGRNRIFAFGIGSACSSFLVKGVARATGGAAEFIGDNERIHEKVLRTFTRLSSPLASDVQIDWGGAEAQTLAEIPPVFDGEVLTVFARVLGQPPRQVSLKCKTGGTDHRWTASVPSRSSEGSGIGTMWARRTIQSLEEVNGISQSVTVKTGLRERKMIVSLSKEFGLLSSLTSFIAIEHRSVEERNNGQPATRRVPVMVPAGWGGTDLGLGFCHSAMPVSAPMQLDYGAGCGGVMGAPPTAAKMKRRTRGTASAAAASAPMSPPAPLCQASDTTAYNEICESLDPQGDNGGGNAFEDIYTVLFSQSAGGDFKWDAKLQAIADQMPTWSALKSESEKWVSIDQADRQNVLSTVWVLILLKMKFHDEQSLWKRAAEKASRYIRATMKTGGEDVLNHIVVL